MMGTFRIKLGREKKKTSKEFTASEKKALFYFLEKNKEDEQALDFVLRWFNCTRLTFITLIIEHEKI